MTANATRIVLAGLLACGLALAAPAAGALSWGVDATGLGDLKSAGVTPALGQVWVGLWTKSSGWGAYEDALRSMKASGVTPVVMWYYWGDSISVSCVQYGCDGRTKSNWDSMARELATRGKNIMGSSPFYVVLEPEFNKQGIQSWETFDGYLASQAWSIKANAPSAKIVLGLGHWGGWDIFDRAAGASELTGFQIMRASTRDTAAEAEGSAQQIIDTAKTLKSRFGKNILVFDLAIASYGGWSGVQERTLQKIDQREAEIEAAGVMGIVWRYVRDNDYSSGYFGAAESYWGVKDRWGNAKPAWDDLLTLVRGGSTGATNPASTAAGTVFSGVGGNEWWIQANVAGSPSSVAARVNGGSWVSMTKQSWGAWAVSTHAPTGSKVELRATFPDGRTATAAYWWPSAAPATTSTTTASSFTATFSNVKGNDWWVQVDVTGNQAISSVAARVNGGSWITLTKQSWGAWAKSIHVTDGSRVDFRATSTTGATAYSGVTTW